MTICFLLREYNKNRDLAKVTSVLNVTCYLEAGFSIILFFSKRVLPLVSKN